VIIKGVVEERRRFIPAQFPGTIRAHGLYLAQPFPLRFYYIKHLFTAFTDII
jgi:hypothetical protein